MNQPRNIRINKFTLFFCNAGMAFFVICMAAATVFLVHSFFTDKSSIGEFAVSLDLKYGDKPLALSDFESNEKMRIFLSVFTLMVNLWCLGIVFILKKLKDILKNFEAFKIFDKENVQALIFIGNLLLAGGLANTILGGAISFFLGWVDTEPKFTFDHFPDFTLIFCGLLIRILARIFAYGVKLQVENDHTV